MEVDKQTLQTDTANHEIRDKDQTTDGGASGMLTFGVTFVLFFVIAAIVVTVMVVLR